MFPGVDSKEHGLVEVSALEKSGLVYVNQSGPVDLSMREHTPGANQHQAYGYFEKAIVHFHQNLAEHLSEES